MYGVVLRLYCSLLGVRHSYFYIDFRDRFLLLLDCHEKLVCRAVELAVVNAVQDTNLASGLCSAIVTHLRKTSEETKLFRCLNNVLYMYCCLFGKFHLNFMC